MQKKKKFQQGFYSHYPHIKPQFHADGLFGIIVLFVSAVVSLNKTICGFCPVLLNYSVLSS